VGGSDLGEAGQGIRDKRKGGIVDEGGGGRKATLPPCKGVEQARAKDRARQEVRVRAAIGGEEVP
jgi:hypothetical protein